MEKIREVFVILEDKPGKISDLARILKKKQISIYAIGLFIDTARLHVSDPEEAVKVILENDYQAELRDVLRLLLPNRVGAILELTQKLGNAGINIIYLYGTIEEKQKGGMIILEVDQPQLALDIFRNHNF
jgi:hypothetical protein